MNITYGYLEQIVVALLCLSFIIRAIRRKAGGVKIAAACILGAYVVVAVGVFFFPIVCHVPRCGNVPDVYLNLIPFHSIMEYCQHFSVETAVQQILGNIVIFLPVGFLVPVLSQKFRSAKNILILSLLLSVGIETVQLIESLAVHYPTKSVDIDDVILNFVGGALGYLVFRAVLESWHKAHMPGEGEA